MIHRTPSSYRHLAQAAARRWRLLTLLLALFLGQVGLQSHAVEHTLADGEPVCELCVVSESAAASDPSAPSLPDTVAVPPVRAPESVPPRAALQAAAARDPPA
ncbi:MAG: hypothetical protein ACLFRB_10390 [Thiohalorhabdus sp.]|uniref:hypothetical protein n=1 Tax=Thiohalorhabdus sp. TaxID=3094134 RepID=UPI00397FD257